jgi:hypothetical protein
MRWFVYCLWFMRAFGGTKTSARCLVCTFGYARSTPHCCDAVAKYILLGKIPKACVSDSQCIDRKNIFTILWVVQTTDHLRQDHTQQPEGKHYNRCHRITQPRHNTLCKTYKTITTEIENSTLKSRVELDRLPLWRRQQATYRQPCTSFNGAPATPVWSRTSLVTESARPSDLISWQSNYLNCIAWPCP